MLKKISLMIMILVFTLSLNTLAVFAGTRTCLKRYCEKEAVKGGCYCIYHTCAEPGCYAEVSSSNEKCEKHKNHYNSNTFKNKSKTGVTSSQTKRNNVKSGVRSSSSGKKKDTYDVYSYKSARDFADDKYEEFYDYEDDFDDEDEAYDAAEDYWREHHKK